MAIQALQHAASPAILNLRNLNPYVSNAVGEWRKARAPAAALLRQLAPATSLHQSTAAAAGASSFGMSGVNAHVVIVAGTEAGPWSAAGERPMAWRRARYASAKANVAVRICWGILLSVVR